jgi:hypothetical protein
MIKTQEINLMFANELDNILSNYRVFSIIPLFSAYPWQQKVVVSYDDESLPDYDNYQFSRLIRCYPATSNFDFFTRLLYDRCHITSRQIFTPKKYNITMIYVDFLIQKRLLDLPDEFERFDDELSSFVLTAMQEMESDDSENMDR